jgi:hypothetical protein
MLPHQHTFININILQFFKFLEFFNFL